MSSFEKTGQSIISGNDIYEKGGIDAIETRERSSEPVGKKTASSGSSSFRRIGKRLFRPAKPIFTVTLLLIFLAIIAVTIYFVMTVGTFTITDPIFRFSNGVKSTYEGETRVFRAENGDRITFTMQNDGQTIELTEPQTSVTSPLYWQEEDRMFLPAMMSVMRPAQGFEPVRTGFYTEIFCVEDGFIANVDNREVRLEDGFLFDGQSVYVFLEDVTVSYQGTSIKMPAMSYAIVVPGLRIELYPYGSEPIVEQTGLVSVSAEADDFLIDMTNDVLQANGEQMLLFTTPSILEVIAS